MSDSWSKSRAGLIAYPVGPPKLNPIATIKPPTISGFIPSAILFTPINKIPKHKIAVPIISLKSLQKIIAGAVENTPNFAPDLQLPSNVVNTLTKLIHRQRYLQAFDR